MSSSVLVYCNFYAIRQQLDIWGVVVQNICKAVLLLTLRLDVSYENASVQLEVLLGLSLSLDA